MEKQLEHRWHSLVHHYTKDQALIQQLWLEIKEHYGQTHRHYHNLTHLNSLFLQLDQYETKLKDPEAVAFAIWYHDIIYKTTSRHNEQKSAEVATDRLRQLSVSEERTQKIFDLIVATKGHHLPEGQNDVDMAYFLDFDLSILGSDPIVYQRYSQQIRQEYRLIPGMLYRPGRIKVLQHLLEHDWLYKTKSYRETLEEQARKNLNWEIAQLAR